MLRMHRRIDSRVRDRSMCEGANMNDKTVIVTGPTSGIGRQIATELARLGAQVILACRDVAKGQTTLEDIARQTGSQKLSVMPVDTSSPASVHAFAQRFTQEHSRLDVLVNNAGTNRRSRQTSANGTELVFATNVLGYFQMTNELLGVLQSSAPARIVNVASTFAGELDIDDLLFERRPYDPIKSYKQSKACNRLLSWAAARQLEGTGVTVNAMCPGMVQTGLYRDTSPVARLMIRAIGLVWGRSVQQGGDTAVWLASSSEVQGLSGRLFELRKEIPCQLRNEELEERLWEKCKQLVAIGNLAT